MLPFKQARSTAFQTPIRHQYTLQSITFGTVFAVLHTTMVDCNLNSQYVVDMQTFRFNSGGFYNNLHGLCKPLLYTVSCFERSKINGTG